MTIIPHIKAALAAHFTDRQKLLLDEFDRVLRDYAEHNEKIFSKFTGIVEDQIMKRFLENVATEVSWIGVGAPYVVLIFHALRLTMILPALLSRRIRCAALRRVHLNFMQCCIPFSRQHR